MTLIEKIEIALAMLAVAHVITLYLFTRYAKEPEIDEHEENYI